jgi:hypothetical protein
MGLIWLVWVEEVECDENNICHGTIKINRKTATDSISSQIEDRSIN